MSEAWSSFPFRMWASGLLERVGAGHGGAAVHPSDIVGQQVTVDEAIDIARRAFLALVEVVLEAGSNTRVHLVADLDAQDAGEASHPELSMPFLHAVLAEDMSISVGASTPEATFQGWEVEQIPITQSMVHVPDGSLQARLRRMRYPGDEAWAVSAEITWAR